jgi:hypothetical protein
MDGVTIPTHRFPRSKFNIQRPHSHGPRLDLPIKIIMSNWPFKEREREREREKARAMEGGREKILISKEWNFK